MHRIEAELLIPGRGDPVSETGVVVLDGPLDQLRRAGLGSPRRPPGHR